MEQVKEEIKMEEGGVEEEILTATTSPSLEVKDEIMKSPGGRGQGQGHQDDESEVTFKKSDDSVFASSSLEEFLSEKKDLKISYVPPESDAVNYVSETTTGMALPDQSQVIN